MVRAFTLSLIIPYLTFLSPHLMNFFFFYQMAIVTAFHLLILLTPLVLIYTRQCRPSITLVPLQIVIQVLKNTLGLDPVRGRIELVSLYLAGLIYDLLCWFRCLIE